MTTLENVISLGLLSSVEETTSSEKRTSVVGVEMQGERCGNQLQTRRCYSRYGATHSTQDELFRYLTITSIKIMCRVEYSNV